MFGSWYEFWGAWADGCLEFGEFWQWLSNLYYALTKTPDIETIWQAFMSFLSPFSVIVPYVVLALCLALAFFGQKLMPVVKFLAFFIIGFVLGVYYFPPLIAGTIALPGWVCGIIMALVVSVLYNFLYVGIFAIAVTYSAYTVCYSGFNFMEITEINVPLVIICAIIAISTLVIAFFFLKYIEMGVTSVVGAYLFTFYFRTMVFDYKSLPAFATSPWVAAFILTIIIAVPAFIVQFKMRKSY